jgi:hypothetical protein
MLDYLASLATLAVLGAHVTVPWRLARGAGAAPPAAPAADPRRAWALAALPALLAAAALAGALAAARPHAALGAGWGELAFTGAAFRAAGVLAAALVLADGVAAFGHRRLEPSGWRLLAVFGLAALAAGSLALELLRIGAGPAIALGPVLAAAGARLLVALSAGEALAPGRPWLAPLAVPGLAIYWLALPPALRGPLIAEGSHLTGAAALLLAAAAPWLPARLRRPAAIAAALLAALLVARAGALTALLPLTAPLTAPPG